MYKYIGKYPWVEDTAEVCKYRILNIYNYVAIYTERRLIEKQEKTLVKYLQLYENHRLVEDKREGERETN